MKYSRGFTLIESIIVIVVMALAMTTITSFLTPQITRSAEPHYQTRAAALGQSVMSLILARGFDQESDFIGGAIRCSSGDIGSTTCTGMAGAASLGSDAGETVLTYNDVDDYIGCWEPEPDSSSSCQDLNSLVGDSETQYRNFRLDITVNYADPSDASLKRVALQVTAGSQPPLTFTAYRGNY